MGDEELTSYITRSREKGRTKDQIIRALYSVGWKKEKVEDAFQKLDTNKNWQNAGAGQPQPQAQQGKTNEPNSATQQQIQMLQQSNQQKQSPAPQQPVALQQPPAQPTQPLPPTQTSQPQPPIALPSLQKKSPFALPSLFQKKQPTQSPESTQQPSEQKKASTLFSLFGKKSEQPVSQPASPSLVTQPLPVQQTTPQKPVQAQHPPQFPAAKETTQPVAKEPERQPPYERMKAAPGVLPPQTTFTIGTQQVSFGAVQAGAKTPQPAGNPAFSNLASAAVSTVGKKSFLPSVALAVILLFAIDYYFFQMRVPEIPQVDGPRIEFNETASKTNTTKPPVLQNTVKKPAVTQPTNNTAKTNGSQLPATQNTTAPAKNTTQTQSTNTSSQPGNQSGTQSFSSHSIFYSSENGLPSKFCQDKNAALYRVHYFEYYGTDCINDKNKVGYSFPIDFPYACDFIPCCYNDVSSSFSRKYDSFECGFYEN